MGNLLCPCFQEKEPSSSTAANGSDTHRTDHTTDRTRESPPPRYHSQPVSPTTTRAALDHRPPRSNHNNNHHNNNNTIICPEEDGFTPSINSRNGRKWVDTYRTGTMLGEGAFGRVFLAQHKRAHHSTDSWRHVAIKESQPNALDLKPRGGTPVTTHEELEHYCQEIKCLLTLCAHTTPSTSRVLYLYEYYFLPHDNGGFVLVTELLEKELDEWRANIDVFTERHAIDICKTILQAMNFIHSKRIVHRDIKLQNILFKKTGDFRSLKIVDFGLARTLEGDQRARDFCGSIGYIPPEMYEGREYRFEVDMFAFGVLLFRLLSGERPFPVNKQDVLRRHTMELRYQVDGQDWELVSGPAKDLVRKLLINKRERYTSKQALNHHWFRTAGASTLRTDFSSVGRTFVHDRSKRVLRSNKPSAIPNEENRFWLDSNLEMALATLFANEISYGCILDSGPGVDDGGLICVEETQNPIVRAAPVYISNLPKYTEADCRRIIRQLANIIEMFHNFGIAHRNLHLDSIMVDHYGQVSVRGLRFAQAIRENTPLTGHFGYLYSWYAFKAPEIDSEFCHSKSVDLWSLGATMYMLLTGLPPFVGRGMELIQAKHAGDINFSTVPVSPKAQRLIEGLLAVNPNERYTIEEVLDDEWIIETEDYLEQFDLSIAHEGLQFFDTMDNQGGDSWISNSVPRR